MKLRTRIRLILALLSFPVAVSAFPVDFDGDGKVDPTVYRPVFGMWYMLPSTGVCPAFWTTIAAGQCQRQWGLPGDVPMTGDFDQDGKADLVVYRPSNQHFYISYSSFSGSVAFQFPDGTGGVVPSPLDKPDVADVNGDGRSDIVVYKEGPLPGSSTHVQVLAHARVYTPSPPQITQYSGAVGNHHTTGGTTTTHYSLSADYAINFSNPLLIHWGDEVAYASRSVSPSNPQDGTLTYRYRDIKINAPSFILGAGIPNPTHQAPQRGNYVVPSGAAQLAIFEISTGVWRYRPTPSSNLISIAWGLNGDIAVPGDYDGNGVTDLAVWRPSEGTWYIKVANCPSYSVPTGYGGCYRQWGLSGDKPVNR